jgi:outer membrane receptor for ferrienterochelin and colicins
MYFAANLPTKGGRMAVAIAAATGILISWAESADLTKLKELSLEEIMEIQIPTVYGASKHEQKSTAAPSAVTVVTREEIQAYGHRTLADILRSVRDFYIGNDRNYNYVGTRGFNRPGDYGGRILILIDGHRLNDAAYDSVGVGRDFPVDVDMIERVEVIRGPGSALYGNNAFFAVIDVITRKAEHVDGAEAAAEYGSFNSAKSRFTYGKRFENGAALLLSGSAYNSDGGDLYFREFDHAGQNHGRAEGRDDERAFNLQGTLSYGDFSLQSAYVWRRKDVPTGSYDTIFNDPRFHTVDERFFTQLSFQRNRGEDWSTRASLYYDLYRYHGDYPYADTSLRSGSYVFRDEVDASRWGADFQISKQILSRHRITLGGEFRNNFKVGLTSYYVDPRVSILSLNKPSHTAGVFLQDEWKVADWMTVSVGARYDWASAYDGALHPRLGLVLQPGRGTTVKLLYGEAFRTPNTYEAAYLVGGYRLNPDLKSEDVRSYEVVLEQALAKRLRFSVSAFYNQISGLISEDYDSRSETTSFVNAEDAETRGASMELEGTFANGIRGRASYTIQRTVDDATGRELSNSPRQLAKLNLMVPLYKDKVSTGFEAQYVGAVQNLRGAPIGDSLVVNWVISTREFVRGLETSFGIYNLFDQHYGHAADIGFLQESIPQDGRTFRLRFNYRF